MNLRNWSRQHTLGLLLGIATTIVAIPIVIMLYAALNDYAFSRQWYRFTLLDEEKSKMISFASIVNLIWFHTLIRKSRYPMAMGIILATVLNLLAIVYFKFIA